ncbi:MAG TPA: NAD+ synthase [Bacteroidetes bacterium]|nr:NAD+ synthase [Bacteroidota bacterium]
MKITLAQLDYFIGDFRGNAEKIKKTITAARDRGSDLVVFSELTVSGYPPLDLLERKEFVEQCLQTVEKVAPLCRNITAIVGSSSINPAPEGKNLYNSAFLLYDGKVQDVIHKSLLPTYDIFDEYRHFEPNTDVHVIVVGGKKIALTICEDLWDEQPIEMEYGKSRLYTFSPMKELAKSKPDLIINIAASPFAYNRIGVKREIITKKAKDYGIPVFFVNQVGAQTELIFEGGSLVVNPRGEIVAELKRFEEDVRDFELEEVIKTAKVVSVSDPDDYIPEVFNAIVLGLKDYFGKMGFTDAILGLSGGIDSAVSVVLAKEALGAEHVHSLLLPSQFSTNHSITDAEKLSRNLGVPYHIIPIKTVYSEFERILHPFFQDLPFNVTEENLQARIRAVLLMAFSNKFGYILLNTSNKSEAAVGYGTLYGDMSGGLSVLGDIYKSDVYKLARYINRNEEVIPENILAKPPSAELSPGQKDSDTLPDYSLLDQILYQYIELQMPVNEITKKGYDAETVRRTIRLVNRNEYKRYQAPPILRISSKAFGAGRRLPLVASYD